MDIRKIRKLIELIKEYGISELEVKEGEESVRINSHSTATHQLDPSRHSQDSAIETIPKTASNANPDTNGHYITSPVVGIFYSSPQPDDPAFVKLNHQVTTGQVLCIIEAMKILNQIESDINGTMLEILVNNGDPVEYGQRLFLIKPN